MATPTIKVIAATRRPVTIHRQSPDHIQPIGPPISGTVHATVARVTGRFGCDGRPFAVRSSVCSLSMRASSHLGRQPC